jgi:hypothetical protein
MNCAHDYGNLVSKPLRDVKIMQLDPGLVYPVKFSEIA